MEAALRPTVKRKRATAACVSPRSRMTGASGSTWAQAPGSFQEGQGAASMGLNAETFRAMVVQRGSELRVAVVRERSEISRRGVELVRARDVHDDTKVHEGDRKCSKHRMTITNVYMSSS